MQPEAVEHSSAAHTVVIQKKYLHLQKERANSLQ